MPKGQQSPILEQAKADGIISNYRVHGFNALQRTWKYTANGDQIELRSLGTGCGGNMAGGGVCIPYRGPRLFIEYRPGAAREARAIGHVAQKKMPRASIKYYEVTTLG